MYQPSRERAIIERMIAENPGPLAPEHIKSIFTEVISACRGLEHAARIAFLGPEHTYSHEAARERFGSSVEFAPQASFAAVFQAVESGRADFGVVPVENSTEGSVGLTLDLLIDTRLKIIGEILLPVRHALLSLSGDPRAIVKIVSHQQSLGQCRAYLEANFPNCEIEAVASNALAAERAARGRVDRGDRLAGGGRPYGLKTIAENIQDLATNTTRFLVMGARPVERTGADKTTVLFAVAGQGWRAVQGDQPVCAQLDQHLENRIASAARASMGIYFLRRSFGTSRGPQAQARAQGARTRSPFFQGAWIVS